MKIIKTSTTPKHLYIDNHPYFLTAAIINHEKRLDDYCKTQLEKLLQDVYTEYGWTLNEWVILDDHYHLLCHSSKGKDLVKIIGKIHMLSARIIKKRQNVKGKVWYNYWDYCPRNEEEYNTRLCYLLNNPYKHGYVKNLKDWKWSSFHKHQSKDKLREMFQEYPDYKTLELE